MSWEFSFFCENGIPYTGTEILWPKNYRKWEWDEDLGKTVIIKEDLFQAPVYCKAFYPSS